jgi:hypothetical protein
MKSGVQITDLQKKTMQEFLKAAGKLTISEYSELVGIERTRFFRLMHGVEMKMREFEKLQIFLDKKREGSVNWEQEIKQTHQKKALGTGAGIDLNLQWQRNIQLREFLSQVSIREEELSKSA